MRNALGQFIKGNVPPHAGIVKKPETKECPQCGKMFTIPLYKERTYCSRICSNRASGFTKGGTSWNAGTKGLMKPNSGSFKKGQPAPTKGLRYSQERIDSMSGENSSRWKGGKSSYPKRLRASRQFSDWRNSVFKRDDYTCVQCGQRGGRLHPHHIESFSQVPEKRFDIENGITFCVKCHRELHRIHGQISNRNHLESFLSL